MRRTEERAEDAAWRRAMCGDDRRAGLLRTGVILLLVGIAVGAAIFFAVKGKDRPSIEQGPDVTCTATVYVSDPEGFAQAVTERETLEAVRALLGLTEERLSDAEITGALEIKTATDSGWVYLRVTEADGQTAADLANALARVGTERYNARVGETRATFYSPARADARS